jgi:serine/threonine-protein kinase
VAGDQAAQNPQNGVGQSANGAGQDQVAPSNGGLNFGGSSPNQGSASAEAAAQTVRDVYELAAAGNYDSSYNLLSTGFRQGQVGSVDSWAGTFSTLESISFIEGPTAGVSGDTARVTGTTRAQHTDGTEFNRGTWTLVLENGEWRLDSVSIQKL